MTNYHVSSTLLNITIVDLLPMKNGEKSDPVRKL